MLNGFIELYGDKYYNELLKKIDVYLKKNNQN